MTSDASYPYGPIILDTTKSPHARLSPVPLDQVQLRDNFWQPRRDINRDVSIPSQYEQCERDHHFDNLRRAAGKFDGPYHGHYWNDSEVYKWLEAAASTLADPLATPALREQVDHVISLLEDAQEQSGYLNSYFQFEKAAERLTFLDISHEVFNLGHLLQAAIAHQRATGEDRLMKVACKAADFLERTFGWASDGKFEYTDGHQEIELALFELGRETGDQKYTDLARFFVDVRRPEHPIPPGILSHLGQAYHQSHLPLREQADAVGHAVRAMFYYAGGADYVLETGDADLREALDQLWQSVTQRRMYITGGVGSRHDGESFGADYELPNATAYCETCAALGLLMWAWRMLHIDPHSRYTDVMERVLYNGLLVGLSLDGQQYFYQNPLEDNGEHRRQQWFGCACCPPNVLRFLAQLPGYFASGSAEGAWLHLYAEGTFEVTVPDGPNVALEVSTRYPWDGAVNITIVTEGTYSLFLRTPSWCDDPHLHINGKADPISLKNGYAEVRRAWSSGDQVLWDLPMEPRRMEARPEIAENRGAVALTRGPLVYCVEACDHPDITLAQLSLAPSSELLTKWRDDLLCGIQVLTAEATVAPAASGWNAHTLYRPSLTAETGEVVSLTAVPYYAWANREAGAMRVWIPVASH